MQTTDNQARAMVHEAARKSLRSMARICRDDTDVVRAAEDLERVIDSWATAQASRTQQESAADGR